MNRIAEITASVLDWLVGRAPHSYGLFYFLLMPIYGLAYYVFPNILGQDYSFWECLYFSIVTATTLGFGDIAPSSEAGKLMAASEAILGILSIGLFLNAITGARIDLVRELDEEKNKKLFREAQRSRLDGHYRVLQPSIQRFKAVAVQISHPVTGRTQEYNPEFKLNDMRDMYRPTQVTDVSNSQPAAIGYFRCLEELTGELCDMVKQVDLRCFPEIEHFSLMLVSEIASFDHAGAILSASYSTIEHEKSAQSISEMLKDYDGDYTTKGSHILDGYVELYFQIKIMMGLLPELENAIENEISKLRPV